MCHVSCIVFGAKSLSKEEVKGKDILEVGSYDVNGTLRPIIESWGPQSYTGVDIMAGPGVDIVCSSENILRHFGNKKFDIVVSTEMLEHVEPWQDVISNLKNICKPGGLLLLTTRSLGFGYHAYPHDHWRYEKEDMEKIFSDYEIISLEKDAMAPGIFIKARRPENFKENDLSDYKLYSVVTGTKINKVSADDYRSRHFRRLLLKIKLNGLIYKTNSAIRSFVKKLIGWQPC